MSHIADTFQVSHCRGCGYQVNQLPTWICPECGGDLRKIGIRPASEPLPISTVVGPLVASVLLVLVPATIISMNLFAIAANYHIVRSSQFHPFWYDQNSAPVHWLSVTTTGDGRWWRPGPFNLREPLDQIAFLILAKTVPPTPLVVDKNGICQQGGPKGNAFNPQMALNWLATAGLDPADPRSVQLANDIVVSVTDIRGGRVEYIGFTDLTSEGYSISSGPSMKPGFERFDLIPWFLALPVWILLVLNGIKLCSPVGIPRCAECGHALSDQPSFDCSGCGRDLRLAGIDVPRPRNFTGMAPILLAATMAIMICGSITGSIVGDVFWMGSGGNSVEFCPPAQQASSSLIQAIAIAERFQYLATGGRPDNEHAIPSIVTLCFQIKGRHPITLFLDKPSAFYYYSANGTRVDAMLGRQSIDEILQTLGMNPGDEMARQLSEDSLTSLKQAWSGNLKQAKFRGLDAPGASTGGGWTGTGGGWTGAGWLARVQWFIWLFLWMIVAIIAFRRRTAAQLTPP